MIWFGCDKGYKMDKRESMILWDEMKITEDEWKQAPKGGER